jgi:acetolactate decarboxylase
MQSREQSPPCPSDKLENPTDGLSVSTATPKTPGHDLHLRLPAGHWQALEAHCARTGESMAHVMRAALADHLDLDHHTLWQISTSTAVVEGVSEGCMRVGDLRQHGDFGLGTFDHLDGEGILLGDQCWQARADGSLSLAPDDELTPFFVVTHFQADSAHSWSDIQSGEDLRARLDPLRPGDNMFLAFRIRGVFQRLELRSASAVESGVKFEQATQAQTVFPLQELAGTMVGFWTPRYASSLNVPGYHFHFVSDDRRQGGHVLDHGTLRARQLTVEVQRESNLRLALPQTKAFLEADLSRDPTQALKMAE